MGDENQAGESKQEIEKTQPEPSNEAAEVDYVAEAQKVAKELKSGLIERVKILEREEKLLARKEALRALGGGSPAGQKAEPHVETPKEYADRVLSGKKQ